MKEPRFGEGKFVGGICGGGENFVFLFGGGWWLCGMVGPGCMEMNKKSGGGDVRAEALA